MVMMLRLQTERMQGSFVPSIREYFRFFGLDQDKLTAAKPDALIMHPGPMNRGVEIDSELADDIVRSAIREQVEMGVAVRMACLETLTRELAANAEDGGRRPGERARWSERRKSRRPKAGEPVAYVNARLLDPASGLDAPGRAGDRGPARSPIWARTVLADGVPEGLAR